MPSYAIDMARSTMGLRFQPSLPGIGARITGMSGQFDVNLGDQGEVDWGSPVRGSFEMKVSDISLGNRFLTAGAKLYLDPKRFESITGHLLDIEAIGANGFRTMVNIKLKDLEVQMSGQGNFEMQPDGSVIAYGKTIADPKDFGVLMPPFINFLVHTKWKIVLGLMD